MSINPTNAPESVKKFHEDAKKAFIGKSPWIIDQHQERTTYTNINRTVVTICDEDGFNSVTLQDSIKTPQDGGRISNVGAFAGAFGTTIEDVRFSEWKKNVYRFWLWNESQREIVEFYYHCED